MRKSISYICYNTKQIKNKDEGEILCKQFDSVIFTNAEFITLSLTD